MLYSENLRRLTPDAMAALGAEQIAYVRPVIVDGQPLFSVHAADGTQIALFANRDVAMAACVQNELEPLSVH
jgi:hypothetical protein